MEKLGHLIEGAQTGDAAAFDVVVRRFQDMAVGYAYARLGDFHLAQDVAQEAFITAYLNLAKLQTPMAFPGWFRRVILTQCSRATRRKRLPTVELGQAMAVASTEMGPDELMEERDLKRHVYAAIRDLPEAERDVITLHYMSAFSQKEIAEFLELPVTTVNNRLHAGRERLTQEWMAPTRKSLQDQRPSRDEVFAIEVWHHIIRVTEEGLGMDKELDFVTDLLAQYLAKEDPAAIAQVLARLDTTLTAVLGRLTPDMQAQVLYHMLRLRVAQFGLLRWTVRDLGGIREVAEIINRSSSATEVQVLDYLDEHDPELAEEIRNYMFTFDDIGNLPDQDIRLILTHVPPEDLAIAMRGAGEDLRERLLATLPDRERRQVTEAMAASGPVRMDDVEQQQLRVVQVTRQLEMDGKVSIIRGVGRYIR